MRPTTSSVVGGLQEAGRRSRGVEFAPDSPLEGNGFEPSVPRTKEPFFVAEGELRGPNGGSQSGEPTIPACQSNNAFAAIPAVRGATTAP